MEGMTIVGFFQERTFLVRLIAWILFSNSWYPRPKENGAIFSEVNVGPSSTVSFSLFCSGDQSFTKRFSKDRNISNTSTLVVAVSHAA